MDLISASLEARNLEAFTQESEKLDAWADDLKVSLQRKKSNVILKVCVTKSAVSYSTAKTKFNANGMA